MPPASTQNPKYQKLPGRGSLAFQHVHLHLGGDHLLQVTSNGFTESYQRFFFSDIQAITFHHTVVGKIVNGVLAALAAFFLLIGLAVNEPNTWIGLSILVAFWLLLLVVNVLLGPTCHCYIVTAVQTRKLPSLSRARRATQAIARLRPLIGAVQGELPGPNTSEGGGGTPPA